MWPTGVDGGGSVPGMALHCAARLVLVPVGAAPDGAIYVGDKKAGDFMHRRVFEPGLTLPWDELTRHATGEPLSSWIARQPFGKRQRFDHL